MKRHVPFLALTVLLGACSRTPEAVTPPMASTPSALYELHFQNLGSAQATASAQRLGGGLGAQRLENAPEPLALGPIPLSTLEFVTTENGKSVRHAQVTFKLTNTAGRTLENLVFLPVALNDTDGDPSNNAQAPTAGGTPFRTVRYFDGSDASALARTLTPVQGQRLNADKTAAQADPNADAYFRGLGTAGLNVVAPAGLSVQVTNGGWLAATTLAAGASTNVTFAVDMRGVDPTNLKATPYSFSLLVTGGEDATATDLSSSVDPARIQGVISNWKYRGGNLVDFDYENPTIYGTVDADGFVYGVLPKSPPLISLLAGCIYSGEKTVDNPGLAGFQSPFEVQNSTRDILGYISERTLLTGQRVDRFYSDVSVTLKGSQDCQGFITDFDVDLERGWNIVDYRLISVIGQTANFSMRSIPKGTRTVLVYNSAREGVQVDFPDAYIALRAGQEGKLDVLINQTGGISGDVTLETDVPGVTISPSTLTLPSLSMTGFQKQALRTTLTVSTSASMAAYSDGLTIKVKKNGVEVGRGSIYLEVVR